MWLDDSRGHFVDWSTQRWVELTGRQVSLVDTPFLEGPVGSPSGIGKTFFDDYAVRNGLRLDRGCAGGLVPDFRSLRGPSFDPDRVSPAVADFYEHTSRYDLDAWSEWCGAFRPFGWALAMLFSRRLQQLNVPLSSLDTSQGMTSDVLPVVDATSGRLAFTAWVRELIGTGEVIYAGAYSTCVVPKYDGRCVRVAFPLPNGNALVIMRPQLHDDGSLTLVSAGSGFGDAGFYFTVHHGDGVSARYLRSLRESIHVYAAVDGGVRANHVLTLWGATFLRLHYRLKCRAPL